MLRPALLSAVLVATLMGCGGERQTVSDLEHEVGAELGVGDVSCKRVIEGEFSCLALRRDGSPVVVTAQRNGNDFDWHEQ